MIARWSTTHSVACLPSSIRSQTVPPRLSPASASPNWRHLPIMLYSTHNHYVRALCFLNFALLKQRWETWHIRWNSRMLAAGSANSLNRSERKKRNALFKTSGIGRSQSCCPLNVTNPTKYHIAKSMSPRYSFQFRISPLFWAVYFWYWASPVFYPSSFAFWQTRKIWYWAFNILPSP